MSQAADDHSKKPHMSYAGLVTKALLSSADRKMTLRSIYGWIEQNYPFFRSHEAHKWRDSVRHTLSINNCFYKAGRSATSDACYWSIRAEDVDEFNGDGVSRRRKRFAPAAAVGGPAPPPPWTAPPPPMDNARPPPPPQPLFVSPMHFAYFQALLDDHGIHLPHPHGSPADWARGWGAILKQCTICLPWQDPLAGTNAFGP